MTTPTLEQQHAALMRQLAIRSLMREQLDAQIRDLAGRIFNVQRELAALAKESANGRTDQDHPHDARP